MSQQTATASLLEAQFNHLILPARVPSKRDDDLAEIEVAIINRLTDACRVLRDSGSVNSYNEWDNIRRVLITVKDLNTGGRLEKLTLLRNFRSLEQGDLLILHVAEQNAGLLIRRIPRHSGEEVLFEVFEASPRSSDVLATEEALQWDFPGAAVSVPSTTFAEESFQESLAGYLQQCSTESIKRFAARASKAGSLAVETRDTSDPAMIASLLLTLLEVHGRRVPTTLLRKRVRDNASWAEGSENPWRRLPFWLVLRVGLARHLANIHDGEIGRLKYKFLICLVLTQLLDNTLNHLDPQSLATLKAKLSRRLAKLEDAKAQCSPRIRSEYDALFASLGPIFRNTLRKANQHIETVWAALKAQMKKHIPPLPVRAPQTALHLALPNSGPYLHNILQNAFHMDKMYTQTHNFNKEAANQSLKPLADRCYTLSQLETEVEDHDRFEDLASSSHDNACMALYRKIDHYVKLVGSTYDGDPEQKSIMILTLMDLWMALDQRNTSIFELLLDFRPGILPEVLDVLQLPHLSDMRRLQRIQRYLHERNERSISTTRTIFDNPSTECFAVRYFDESDPETLGTLYQEINRAEALSRAAKEMEWEKSSKEYENLEKRIAESTCVFKQDEPYPEHDDKRCTKCYLRRCARRTTIAIHEDFLPADSVHAKAAVFELRCPPAFAAYRNATWKIIGVLGRQKLVDRSQPRLRLQEYSNLSPFTQSSIGGITLASTTKSFLDTHYRVLRFPVGLSEVCKPNGLKLAYFDAFTKMWPGLQRVKPSFAHHCPLIIPPNSSFAVLRFPSEFASDGPGRTSNEIISSHTLCPSGLNPYEYMSFQSLFSGKHRRWPLILLELASSNLNFGNEATSILISQLSAQAGPAHENDPLRTIHHIFRHESFCKRLVDQINERVRTISVNWRETNCMDMLITLILRLLSLTSDGPSYDKASALLTKVRAATYGWTHQLREEIHNAKDGDTSRICSRYALWAALLCRKTFSRHSADPRISSTVSLSVEELKCFIVSSITLQDNMITDPATMPSNLRAALIRDLKMTYRMRFLIQQSVKEHYQGLFAAIDSIWPQPSPSGGRTYSEPIFLNGKHCWVVQLIAQGPYGYKEQMVHYDILEGHLLIDNKPLGRLPTDIRTSPILAELFGSQNLLTYPSGLLGMAYRVSLPSFDHEVHIGFRGEQMIIRDYFQGKLWELIPRGSFARGNIYDLPALLVDDSFHWLDLNSGILHIRPCAAKWKPKDSNWQIDLKTHIGTRRSSRLVDPHSPIFRKIANIFEGFEDMRFLTVYQPRREPLSVELRRLQLTFKVSKTGNGSLCCNELNAEVDRNQDAGTWYGLSSKLVLCDTLNLQERIIVVPMGSIRVRRNKFHVAVSLDQNGYYAKYSINQIIGRLDCPAEPRMLYLKAQLHAYTSSVVPDSLTGRTGTEESLHFLQSGICQPWEPLDLPSLRYLASIADLTPTREYYPKGLKVMQSTHWNPTRTTIMQRDEFLPLVQSIYQKSLDLVRFSLQRPELPKLSEADVHLLQRGIYQRQLYERQVDYCRTPRGSCDLVYDARDGFQNTQEYKNVFEAVTLISKWSTRIPAPADLAGIFQAWPIIQGYGHSYGKILLSDYLSTDFALDWGSLVEYCRGCTQAQLYHLSFMFAILSFSADVNMDVIRTLIAFAISNNMKKLNPPTWPSYSNFRHNHVPTADSLAKLMESCVIPYKEENYRGLTLTFKMKQKFEVARRDHEEKAEKDCKRLAVFLLEQWPCVEPTIDGLSDEDSLELDVPKTLTIVKPEWLRLFQNLELSKHITQIQQVLKHFDAPFDGQPLLLENDEGGIFFPGCGKKGIPHLMTHLLCKSIDTHTDIQTDACSSTLSSLSRKENIPVTSKMQSQPSSKTKKMPREMVDLFNIIGSFSKTKSTVMKDYTSDLKQSLEALKSLESRPRRMENNEMTPVELIVDIAEAQQKVEEIMMRICQAFEKDDPRAKWLKEGGLWPCITRVTLLEQLRSTSTVEFGSGMKEILVEYALSLTQLQRIMRLREANRKNNNKKFEEEKSYAGHENWQPASHPDWVLLEIEANILIRPGQVDVALATISPTSGSNSVLQMNMGQGKTSCIIPMVAASLADTNRLVRVVVPKALLLQTAQLLHARLGGLLGRELRHIPFSRKTPTDQETTKAFLKIHKDMMSASGIMISLPEHIMSFMLSGMQRVSDNRIAEATSMINIQGWMRKVCRDVLDESDFTLAVKTQLIYPSGQQTTVDGQPRRWEIPETLLGLVEKHIWSLKREYPRSLDVVNRPVGGFPLIYFLRKDAEDALISLIVNDIMRGHTSILPMQDCSTPERQAIRNYIITAVVRPRTMTMIDTVFPDKPIAKQTLHLLRGLLVNRILLLTLKKRWSVQYGLHPMRDPVAVPFHAKGVPSDQAEWGHPDVAILFTCLSFYYGGLTISQLQQGLEHVVKSDDPSSEYDRWMQGVKNIPDSLREWNVINVDDEAQLNEVWKCLRYSTVAIDYYLNHFVFPRHARQFKIQLQSSAWDIPLLPNVQTSQWKSSEHRPLTTGFSGTNDSRSLLPLTIKQQDLPRLSHTNAEVLTYLLQPRNRQYIIAAGRNGKRLSEKDFLYKLKEVKIRILIDAGAQILEMDNHTLVRTWLEVDTEAKAALFFTDENQPLIMYRNNKTIPLVASPFADDLKECLVYLDEAHTRGTDLRLGPEAKGALTLGLGQSKDQTVQAAMRLRQLATTQSVVFFAGPEVHQSILDQRKYRPGSPIDSYDVICWLLEQTCNGIEQLQPLYYSQGRNFCHRSQALLDHKDFLSDAKQREACLEELQQIEHQTVEQLYKPKSKPKSGRSTISFSPQNAAFMKELNTRRKGFQDHGFAVHGSALQEVEQEREQEREVESVREVQKPVHYSPLEFGGLHSDIVRFVQTGKLPAGSTAYEHMFVCLRRTALGLKCGVSKAMINSKLFVSAEFPRSVELQRPNDNFLRQVNWLLWSTKTETAIIVVPEEAELLIPLAREISKPVTHLLTYAAPVTRKMLHLGDLTYLAIPDLPPDWRAPDWLKTELGLFAGRLYFEFDEYPGMAKYLGLREDGPDSAENPDDVMDDEADEDVDDEGLEDGEVLEDDQLRANGEGMAPSGFTARPLTFLQEWLAIRRKGQDFTHTPMGYVCHERPLHKDHPFYAKVVEERLTPAPAVSGHKSNGVGVSRMDNVDDDDDDDFDDDESDGVGGADFWDAEEEHDVDALEGHEVWQDAEEGGSSGGSEDDE